MYITITISYETAYNRLSQAGQFPLRGRRPEKIASDWWKIIKKDTYNARLVRVVLNADTDITDQVRALDQVSLPVDNLPF